MIKGLRYYGAVAACLMLAFGIGVQQSQAAQNSETYIAKITPLNSKAAGHETRGILRIKETGDTLLITLNARGLPPGMMHMVHLHGFQNGTNAVCPTTGADVNQDGVIDLNETEPMSGVTMIPLNGDPAALEIATSTYPHASASGRLHYEERVSLPKLKDAFQKNFHGATLDLSKLVVFIHGVPDGTKLPETAASLPGVPAQVTLPIACGKLELKK